MMLTQNQISHINHCTSPISIQTCRDSAHKNAETIVKKIDMIGAIL